MDLNLDTPLPLHPMAETVMRIDAIERRWAIENFLTWAAERGIRLGRPGHDAVLGIDVFVPLDDPAALLQEYAP